MAIKGRKNDPKPAFSFSDKSITIVESFSNLLRFINEHDFLVSTGNDIHCAIYGELQSRTETRGNGPMVYRLKHPKLLSGLRRPLSGKII